MSTTHATVIPRGKTRDDMDANTMSSPATGKTRDADSVNQRCTDISRFSGVSATPMNAAHTISPTAAAPSARA